MNKSQKPDAHNNWMDFAFLETEKSDCMRPEFRIGCVAVLNGKIVASGFNGYVGKLGSCETRGFCIRQKRNIPSGTQREVAYCICAEQRMICNAARSGIRLDGAEVYVTHLPCAVCIRLMIESGIVRVFYRNDYSCSFTKELAHDANFELIKLN